MSCINFVSFEILINVVACPFFKSERGIIQGFPLSPLLFLIVAKGHNRSLKEAVGFGNIKGINVGTSYNVTHLLFVDEILIFHEGTRRMVKKLRGIINLFCEVKGITLNIDKSTISLWGLMEYEKICYLKFFLFRYWN
jgi:hypothetical protein